MLFQALSILAITLVVKAQSGGFINSCSGPYLSGTYLRCVCGNNEGGQQNAEIDLNSCFLNSNGDLVYYVNGGGLNSCDVSGLGGNDGVTLFATCGTYNGGYLYNALDLNNYIGNFDGQLSC